MSRLTPRSDAALTPAAAVPASAHADAPCATDSAPAAAPLAASGADLPTAPNLGPTGAAPGPATALIQHPYQPPGGFAAVAPGVYKASTVLFPSVCAVRARRWKDKSGYTYGLHGTPTTFTLEERIATLEGGQHCLLCPSGLAAIALVNLTLLQSGDEVLLPDNAYSPGKELAQAGLSAWGIQTRLYDPMQPAHLAGCISARTRLVWLEVPGSVTLEYPDLAALLRVVQAANEARASLALPASSEADGSTAETNARPILTALDNTWGAGVAFCGFDGGADIVLQALTKYPSGGGDVLMGSVVTRASALHQRLQQTHMRLGLGVAANDAEALLRGLPTLHLRYHAQDTAARHLAHWMQQQSAVAQVLHPALPGAPGHAHWLRHARAAASLFSVVWQPHYTAAQIDAFCERLHRFRLGYSWGGPLSLCMPYDVPALRSLPWPHAPYVVRFAVGLEDVADLQADLAQALAALG